MIRSRRVKYAVTTAPLQILLSIVLALLFAQVLEDSSGEWADLIGVLMGLVFGPSIGAAIMIFFVQRARAKSTSKVLLASSLTAIGTFSATLLLIALGIHPFAVIVTMYIATTIGVWVLSGRD